MRSAAAPTHSSPAARSSATSAGSSTRSPSSAPSPNTPAPEPTPALECHHLVDGVCQNAGPDPPEGSAPLSPLARRNRTLRVAAASAIVLVGGLMAAGACSREPERSEAAFCAQVKNVKSLDETL